MTRINNNKSPFKPPGKHSPSSSVSQASSSSTVKASSSSLMVLRAISSAGKHGVELQHGRSNTGDGNCAFESAIFNLNDRQCFGEHLPMSIDYYRRIWMTDMKNRTLTDPTWNIYSQGEWEAGWADMLKSGVYERGIFGDLMLFGIACGLKKNMLIFNTSLESPHDPIYVVDPRKFGVEPDGDTPLVVAYNLSHYESMHPVQERDIEGTKKLVREYLNGAYQFSKKDLPSLLSLNIKKEDTKDPLEGLQSCLPQHLRGKRPREIDKDEKKLYNSIRQKFAKAEKTGKETEEQRKERSKKDSLRKATERANISSAETEEQSKNRKEKENIRKANEKVKEVAAATEEQIKKRKEKANVRERK